MARVRLEGVRKVYDNGYVAVHDVSLEVADGEFVVLVGPSGSGKSTVLRMIAGLESISDGKLYIGDPLVNDVAPKDRDIAMVFQNYALYPHMSVRDNLAFALKLRKLPPAEIEQRIAHAADFLGLAEIMDRKPAMLSGGQRQRVAVGRALVREPQVFLFDEPLSNLDAKLRVQMRREIAALHRRLGVTMIYVTHDQVEAMTLGDRVAVLADGKLQQIGTPMELYDHPANLFVAGFIGSPAMNFIPGKITGGGVRFRSEADGFLDFEIPAALAQTLAETTGSRERPAILGIRPEAIYPVNAAYVPAESARATLELDVIEPLGNEILLQARASGQEIVARIAPQPLPPVGTAIELAFDLTRLHFFDPRTEGTIGGEPPA